MIVRVGSMFSGYEGLGLALIEVFGDVEHVFVADVCKVDKHGNVGHHEPHRSPCSILAHRFPGVPNLGDVSLIDWAPWRGRVDIVSAGFPCQDVSVAGVRAGLRDGTRTGLWSQVVRAITELSPRLVVLENVPGIFTASAAGDVEPCSICLGDGSGEHLRAHRRPRDHLERGAQGVRQRRRAPAVRGQSDLPSRTLGVAGGRMTTLTLPWRTPPLSLNQRLHWAAKARLSRTVRNAVHLLAKTDRLPSYTVPVVVTLHYRQKVRRPIDADNLYATVKPCLDGLRDAGVLHDDTTAHVTPLIEVHEPIPGEPGAMWLTIAPAETRAVAVEVGRKP